jgi:drug/metabolite transporter (DMT)-like permease
VTAARTRQRAWIAWTAVCIIWGTTYLAIKIGLETIPPFLMGGLRYLLGGGVLAAILVARRRPLPPRSAYPQLAMLGFFMMMLGNGGVVWGAQFMSSGLTAVMVGTSAFWMAGVDAVMPGGGRLGARQWLGLVIGFAGIVLLVWPDVVHGGMGARGLVFGVIALQTACFGWAIGANYLKRHILPGDLVGAAALQMIFGGVFMLAAGTLMGEWTPLTFNTRTSVALAYLAIAGSVVAFTAYSYALKHLPVSIVSLSTYVNPIIAVVLGVLVLGEHFEARMFVAVAVVIVGMVTVGPARGAAEPME